MRISFVRSKKDTWAQETNKLLPFLGIPTKLPLLLPFRNWGKSVGCIPYDYTHVLWMPVNCLALILRPSTLCCVPY